MKSLILIARNPTIDAGEFCRWLLEECLPLLIERRTSTGSCVLNLANVSPPWPVDPLMGELTTVPSYDAMLEWCGDDVPEGLASLRSLAKPRIAAIDAYQVAETVDKHDSLPTRVRQLSLWRAHEGLGADLISHYWDSHVPLALRVQAGASSYLRHRVELPLTPGAPPLSGITSVGFSDEQELVAHQYDSPEAAYALLEDSCRFIAEESVCYVSVHALDRSAHAG